MPAPAPRRAAEWGLPASDWGVEFVRPLVTRANITVFGDICDELQIERCPFVVRGMAPCIFAARLCGEGGTGNEWGGAGGRACLAA